MSVASGVSRTAFAPSIASLETCAPELHLDRTSNRALFHLQAARRRLFGLHQGTQPVLCSKVYETSPVDCPADSPLFLNAVLELSSEMEPQEFLAKLKSIERDLGRRLSERETALA